ncbi:hypothetical protein FNV43_RR22496 [Rhamnella rubrinervis]|uniref:Uncharacterized protein n=1 Tax=Rhamnella rubrinervis TaxID=2594499 RepID=A0A8K0DQB5_9ROSA|nr:hypothetical protein FNV43_RR22496 [Rhamnella rubrinervis]
MVVLLLGPIKAPHGVAFTRVSSISWEPRQQVDNIFGQCQPDIFLPVVGLVREHPLRKERLASVGDLDRVLEIPCGRDWVTRNVMGCREVILQCWSTVVVLEKYQGIVHVIFPSSDIRVEILDLQLFEY